MERTGGRVLIVLMAVVAAPPAALTLASFPIMTLASRANRFAPRRQPFVIAMVIIIEFFGKKSRKPSK
jgi:hypothetical protein